MITTRARTEGRLIEPGFKSKTLKTFISDATSLWNQASSKIRLGLGLHSGSYLKCDRDELSMELRLNTE